VFSRVSDDSLGGSGKSAENRKLSGDMSVITGALSKTIDV
jgi:hypothetical protein